MADAPELSVNVSAATSAPALAVHAATGAGSGSGSGPAKSALQELIISTLNIPIHLTDRSNKGNIHMAYAKYVVLLAALNSMSALVTSGTWTHSTVANDDMIEIFMSKSAYFKNHSKVFTMVNRHPLMKEWLLNADDGPSDYEVWGYQNHTFDVLKAILTAMPPPPVDIKGKGKEKVDLDLSSSPVEKRKKKGAAKTMGKKEKKRADYNDKKYKKKGEGRGKASTSK
jgi:cyclophilin family peptidyl-prolyl cis-trans isomerase